MVTVSIEDFFKCLTNRTIPCACATIISKECLECSIQFAEKSRNGKRALFWIAETWHRRVSFSEALNVYHHIDHFTLH